MRSLFTHYFGHLFSPILAASLTGICRWLIFA
nr:MAG TPA: Protection of telomeres protein poz1, sheterin, hub, DNA BINDING.1A [Caudoviricetes sp.]